MYNLFTYYYCRLITEPESIRVILLISIGPVYQAPHEITPMTSMFFSIYTRVILT